jgi:hypothetical protein
VIFGGSLYWEVWMGRHVVTWVRPHAGTSQREPQRQDGPS